MTIQPNGLDRRRTSVVPELIDGSPKGEGALRIGAHFVPQGLHHQVMDWQMIQRIVTTDDLTYLERHPDCEKEYMEWSKAIKQHYGGLEQYLAIERLGWDRDKLPTVNGTASPSDVMNDAVIDDPSNIKVVFNDWPYGIPPGSKHYVVWCKHPIIAPVLFETSDTPFAPGPSRKILFEAISADGIRGLTGSTHRIPVVGDRSPSIVKAAMADQIDPTTGKTFTSPLGPTGLGPEFDLAEATHHWAGRFVDKFIKRYWPTDEWETAYFCNPPHLRTVPGISHFHVLAREREHV